MNGDPCTFRITRYDPSTFSIDPCTRFKKASISRTNTEGEYNLELSDSDPCTSYIANVGSDPCTFALNYPAGSSKLKVSAGKGPDELILSFHEDDDTPPTAA